MYMNIKEIRSLTGLSQKDFGLKYHIPLDTIKKWEMNHGSKNHRECPSYVMGLLERVVKEDYTR